MEDKSKQKKHKEYFGEKKKIKTKNVYKLLRKIIVNYYENLNTNAH